MFTLEIETGNAAFEDNAPRTIAEMLRLAADVLEKRIDHGAPAYLTLADVNGNTVGAFYYRPILDTDNCAVSDCGAPAVMECRINGEMHSACARHGAP